MHTLCFQLPRYLWSLWINQVLQIGVLYNNILPAFNMEVNGQSQGQGFGPTAGGDSSDTYKGLVQAAMQFVNILSDTKDRDSFSATAAICHTPDMQVLYLSF